MHKTLHYNTVNKLLLSCLKKIMKAKQLKEFRLVGGTALSLFKGHRESIDIDLFTDAKYNSIDFKAIDDYLKKTFNYVDSNNYSVIGMGKSYYVGEDKNNCIKLDIYYTDEFIQAAEIIDNIRLASIEEIIAMKIDVVLRGGRKKDFWDLHELMNEYSLNKMLSLHEERYPYNHNKKLILTNLINFTSADIDFDPICLKNKHWELIKLDFIDFVNKQT